MPLLLHLQSHNFVILSKIYTVFFMIFYEQFTTAWCTIPSCKWAIVMFCIQRMLEQNLVPRTLLAAVKCRLLQISTFEISFYQHKTWYQLFFDEIEAFVPIYNLLAKEKTTETEVSIMEERFDGTIYHSYSKFVWKILLGKY